MDSSLTPVRAVREQLIPFIPLPNTISRKGLTNNSNNCPVWPDKFYSGKLLQNNFHSGHIKRILRCNLWWYGFRRRAIYNLLQNKLYHPYWPSIWPSFPISLFLDYFPNSNNRLSSYLQLGLELFAKNIGMIMVLFCRFYSCQSINGHILRFLEAPFNLWATLVFIFSKMAFMFYFLPITFKTRMWLCLHLSRFFFRAEGFLLISRAISAAFSSISAILRQVNHLTSAEFSSISSIFLAIF